MTAPAVRTHSLPSSQRSESVNNSQVWNRVLRRSNPGITKSVASQKSPNVTSLTSSHFHDKEAMIIKAQKVLRLRSSSSSPLGSSPSAKSRRTARRKLRQHLLAEEQSRASIDPASEPSSHLSGSESVCFDRGRSLRRYVPPPEA